MIATIVEWKALGETVVASVVIGVGVTFAFSVAIWGAGRFTDLRGGERRLAAASAALVASLALCAVAAAVVLGILVMTRK
jgi:hypothetical protein